MLREKWPYLLTIILIFCGGFVYLQCQTPKTNVTFGNEVSAKETSSTAIDAPKVQKESEVEKKTLTDIVVDVKGAVNKPGVYHMTQGDRIVDVLDKAGGFTAKADKSKVNLARKLSDEMMVYIPSIGEKVPDNLGPSTEQGDSSESGKININTASEQELEQIPGIGPSKAGAIIEFREKNGPFQKVEDLDKVSGFGEKTVERMKELISVQ